MFGIVLSYAYTCQYEMASQALNRGAGIACLPPAVFLSFSRLKRAVKCCCHSLYITVSILPTVLSAINCTHVPSDTALFTLAVKMCFHIMSIIPIPIPISTPISYKLVFEGHSVAFEIAL